MITKETLIKRLRNNQMYRDALKMAKTDVERRKIIATTENFLSNLVEKLSPVFEKASNDPKFAEKLQEAINSSTNVITDDDNDQASD